MAKTGIRVGSALVLALTLAACGQSGGLLRTSDGPETTAQERARERLESDGPQAGRQSLLGDLFANTDDPNTTIEVNKYIWNAALDVLNFMPIERVDPFSGVIVMGYGTPPGGRTAYRATVFVRDPALEARSLSVALVSRAGPASGKQP